MYLYSDRKPHVCQKLVNSPGVGKCPAPRQRKICKCPTPSTDKAGNAPCNSPVGGWGGGGTCAQLELTDALSRKNFDILDVKNIFFSLSVLWLDKFVQWELKQRHSDFVMLVRSVLSSETSNFWLLLMTSGM